MGSHKKRLEELSMARMYQYRIGIGCQGMALEYHRIEAANEQEARSIGIRKFLHPDKGYDYIEVKRISNLFATKKKGE